MIEISNKPTRQKNELIGLCARLAILTVAMAFTAVLAAFTQAAWSELPVDWPNASIALGTLWWPMILALIVSEYPRGEEFLLLRLAGATFCRTGMPLLVILLLRYSKPQLVDQMVFTIVSVYAAGLVTSILLSVLKLGNPSQGQDLNEVQSVIH